ncbi:unnamed protein product, partial [Didymodactylos carnosus]
MGCVPSHSSLYLTSKHRSREEIHIIVKDMWAEVCSRYYKEVGIKFMVCLMMDHPELKSLWIFAANLNTESEIRSNTQVRYHASKIMNTLNVVIQDIHNDEKRKETLYA